MLIVKANPATGDRGAQKQTKSWWDGPQNNRHARTSKAIRAELIGSDICTALGLTINSSSSQDRPSTPIGCALDLLAERTP
jgi:hypothetical protein